jgi:AcrR family transcriptional regulator
MQARAEATRRKILDCAVDLFNDLGYGDTGLTDVLQRAGVSKGAFYYHFDSKEAVAAAIIDEYNEKLLRPAREMIDPNAPTVQSLIRASFEAAAIIQSDKLARVGNELMQGLGQISATATRIYADWCERYIAILGTAIADWELVDGLNPTDVAEAVWTGIIGSHLLSAAIGDDRFERLGRVWKLVLLVSAPQGSREELRAVIEDALTQYRVAV